MPCNSDYMEQKDYEKKIQQTAQLLIWVRKKLNMPADRAAEDADTLYPSQTQGDYVVSELCKILSNLNDNILNEIVYNGKNKTSRKLADWWDEHLDADKARIMDEIKKISDKKDRDAALSKLSKHERELLGIK